MFILYTLQTLNEQILYLFPFLYFCIMNRKQYKPKDINFNNIIYVTGLCGKALNEDINIINIKNQYENKSGLTSLDENKLYSTKSIRKTYNNIKNKYIENNIEINEYNHKCILNRLYCLIPFIYCTKCDSLNKYRVYNYSIECNKCVEKRSYIFTRNKRKSDNIYRFIYNFRQSLSIRCRTKKFNKSKKTEDILGCDFTFFKSYIENKFTKGMTWENYGKWHLDHIYPVSKAITLEDFYRLNHYSNFQPLWAKDNFKKNAKIIPHQLKLTI